MPSFAGGEISDQLFGRVDLAKYDVGAARLENCIVQRYGGISNRPGTKFLRLLGTGGADEFFRLIPFRYNAQQNYVVCFHGESGSYQKIDVLDVAGNVVKTLTSVYQGEDLKDLKYCQSADVLFLVHPDYPPYELVRMSASSWVFQEMELDCPPFEDDLAAYERGVTITPSAVTGTINLTTNFNDVITEDDVGTMVALTTYAKSEYKKGVPGTEDDLVVNALPGASVYVESFGFWNGDFSLEKRDPKTGVWQSVRTQFGNRAQNYNFTEVNYDDVIVEYKITTTGFDNQRHSGEADGQTGCVSIQSFGNDYTGLVKILSVINPRRVQARVVRKLASTDATSIFARQSWGNSRGYPCCCCFFEDRLVFAGSSAFPQTVWMSRSGDYYDFGVSVPGQDYDSVTATVNSGQMNGIKALVAKKDLLAFTGGGVFQISGNGKAVSPSNVVAMEQETRGISSVDPLMIDGRIVFVENQGDVVSSMDYSYDVEHYSSMELTLLASHLFQGHKLKAMAFQRSPGNVLWCVRDDGLLLGLTYLHDQQMYAWHKHSTEDGVFEDVVSIPGATQDEVFLVVKRDGVAMLEILAHRDESGQVENQFFVDSGKELVSSSPITSVSGLSWLEGKTVKVLADGHVLPDKTVEDGEIELGGAFNRVAVGLGIKSVFVGLPVDVTAQDGTYMSRRKRVGKLVILYKNSSGGLFGLEGKGLDRVKWRTDEPYNEPIQLFSGKKELLVRDADWIKTVQVRVEQSDPLPISILSVVAEMQGGG